MIRELLCPRSHKLAVVASVCIVGVLTGIGVWTNSLAERQTTIEHKVKVQHTEVVQALCERPFTRRCAHHAVNVVRTCVAVPRCARLLNSAVEAIPIREPSNSSSEISEGPGFFPQTHPSAPGGSKSQGGSPGGGEHGGGHGGKGGHPGHHGGGGKGHSSPPPPPAPPAEPPPVLNPAGHEPPGLQPGHGHTKGLVPGATAAVEGVVGCAARLDLGCATEEILGPSEAGN